MNFVGSTASELIDDYKKLLESKTNIEYIFKKYGNHSFRCELDDICNDIISELGRREVEK